jgi:hypothetical protein
MKKGLISSFAEHLILGLSILLVFLIIFDPWLAVPDLLLFAGRLHPVILHFPIVLVVLAVINSFTKNKHYQDLLLPSTAIFALITAITGFLLSEENTSKGETLISHQWMGSAVAILTAIWYAANEKNRISPVLSGILRVSLVLLVVTTGHYGGMITHGENYLAWDRHKTETETFIPEDPLVFEHLVLPVLEGKCFSCHNENKSKGGLVLTNFASLMKGGEYGAPVIPGDPGKSEMIRRIHLPDQDEDHMPPADHEQLTTPEIALIESWIASGTSADLRVSSLDSADPFYATVSMFIIPDLQAKWKNLPEIKETTIELLSSDYCTIRRMAENSNALAVMVLPHADYTTRRLAFLNPVMENIVELDLSFLPLEEEEINFISGCKSLEWLEIDFTPVDDDQFNRLDVLQNLRVLKAQGSRLTEKSIEKILSFKNLQKLFVWDTGIPEEHLARIRDEQLSLEINAGIGTEISFTSILPAPRIKPARYFFVDPIEIQFDHPLKDIDIFYSLNQEDPLKDANLFSNPILIEHNTQIRYLASKEGWVDSPEDSMTLFKTLGKPDVASLAEPPDPKYPGKGEISLFDLVKGPSFPQDSAWLGFQHNKMVLKCQWKKEITLKGITLSSLVNTGIHIFPPAHIEVHGGNEQEQRLLGHFAPVPAGKGERAGFRYISCPLAPESFTHLVITVTPLEKLPEWHNEKGKPGWFFIDEVILEE